MTSRRLLLPLPRPETVREAIRALSDSQPPAWLYARETDYRWHEQQRLNLQALYRILRQVES